MKATIIAVLAVTVVAAGCGGADDAESAKRSAIAPVTLRIGTDDEPGKPAADQIEELARRVAKLSDGAIRIEPVWHAAGDGPDWDQRVARMVTSGELEMGLIPTRSWDTEGVTSLRALNAPFLIDERRARRPTSSPAELADDLHGRPRRGRRRRARALPRGPAPPVRLEEAADAVPTTTTGKAIRTPTSRHDRRGLRGARRERERRRAGPAHPRRRSSRPTSSSRAGRRPATSPSTRR